MEVVVKKTFPCGHIGKGQYCHRCHERDVLYEREREIKRKEKAELAAEINVGVDMSSIPSKVARKAADMIRKIDAGTPYTMFHGKRLTDWDRSVISVPVGWSHRMMLKEEGGKYKVTAVLSHEEYNTRTSKAFRP